ncbi:MAG: hypothetical protein AVDCRST_MAG76-1812, partial [uncultured Acidimicrobiales bacterium]
ARKCPMGRKVQLRARRGARKRFVRLGRRWRTGSTGSGLVDRRRPRRGRPRRLHHPGGADPHRAAAGHQSCRAPRGGGTWRTGSPGRAGPFAGPLDRDGRTRRLGAGGLSGGGQGQASGRHQASDDGRCETSTGRSGTQAAAGHGHLPAAHLRHQLGRQHFDRRSHLRLARSRVSGRRPAAPNGRGPRQPRARSAGQRRRNRPALFQPHRRLDDPLLRPADSLGLRPHPTRVVELVGAVHRPDGDPEPDGDCDRCRAGERRWCPGAGGDRPAGVQRHRRHGLGHCAAHVDRLPRRPPAARPTPGDQRHGQGAGWPRVQDDHQRHDRHADQHEPPM